MNKKTFCNLMFSTLILFASFALWMNPSFAADFAWTGAGGDSNWTTGDNWVDEDGNKQMPALGDNVTLSDDEFQSSVYFDDTNNYSYGNLLIDMGMTLDKSDGNDMTYAGGARIGGSGNGTFSQSGGTTTVSGGDQIWQDPRDPKWKQYAGLVLGNGLGSSGYYNLTSGSLNVTHASIVGEQDYGEFNLGSGIPGDPATYTGDGTHTTGDLYVGYGADASSTYNLFSGTLNVVGSSDGAMGFTVIGGKAFFPGSIDKVGSGTFNQYGGVHNTTGLFLTDTAGSSSAYNLEGGDLNVLGWGTSIGGAGDAVFNQSGGTHTVSEDLNVFSQSGVGGTYNLSGGKLDVSTVGTDRQGLNNSGTFNYSGGELNIHQGAFTNNGNFNLSGDGTRTVNGDVVNNAGGTIKVTDTTAVFTGTFTNSGAYQSDPSSNYFNNLTITSTGYLTGGAGDYFGFSGGLSSASTNPLWSTAEATLAFVGSGPHTLLLDPANSNSFHWGTLALDSGAELNFSSGLTGNLYVRNILVPDLDVLDDISKNLNVYYEQIFRPLEGGGAELFNLSEWTPPSNLTATPEPASCLLFGLGGLAMAIIKKKRGVK